MDKLRHLLLQLWVLPQFDCGVDMESEWHSGTQGKYEAFESGVTSVGELVKRVESVTGVRGLISPASR